MASRFDRVGNDDKLDRYYTPKWVTKALLEKIDVNPGESVIGEPCAGQGHIAKVLEQRGIFCRCSDIDPNSPYRQGDATDLNFVKRKFGFCTGIITNPPYSADTGTAFQVLDTLLNLEIPIAMLLRLSFLEPPKENPRKKCYEGEPDIYRPSRIIVLPRVNFEGPGLSGKDSSGAGETSCWIIWKPDEQSEPDIEWCVGSC